MENRESNLAKAQALYDAFFRKDIPAMLQLLHEAVEWGEPTNPHNPAGGTRHGHAGFMEWLNIGRESEEILELHPQRFLSDDDAVTVVGSMKCKVIHNQKIYESDFVHLIVFQEGKVRKFQEFFDTWAAGEAFR